MKTASKPITRTARTKIWGGAFSKPPADVAWKFGQSIDSDMTLWKEEIDVSIAHATMLEDVGLLTAQDAKALKEALACLRENAAYMAHSEHVENAEDLHGAIEAILVERVGEAAKRLHAGRSRNDQIVTVTRLWLKRRCADILAQIEATQGTLLLLAEQYANAPMPGYTHQQPAQPITVGHHLLAHFWMLQRDRVRFDAVNKSADECPLGAAALAGTTLPIDRQQTCDLLGFATPMPNTLDAVSDRDFIGDALHACATLMQHLSRAANEIALFSTAEFGYLRLDDAYSTGSSIMPQKRNPDMAELIRGRTGRVIGHWTGFMSMMKGLPLGYNRDQQEDKPPLFDSIALCEGSLTLLREMLATATFHLPAMEAGAAEGFSTATGLAEALVGQGVPFRVAHDLVGAWVKQGGQGAPAGADALVEATVASFDPSVDASLKGRETQGGPGPAAMAAQLELAKSTLSGGVAPSVEYNWRQV